MSGQIASEHVCYVHCNYCSTILAVSVPRNCLFNMVTVRCGHCTNLLTVNMAPLLQSLSLQDQQEQNKEFNVTTPRDINLSVGNHRLPMVLPMPIDIPETAPPIPPPEKRQRVPSAYNKFIKEEIQRIKASNPEISHREAFSAAAKNITKKTESINVHGGVHLKAVQLTDSRKFFHEKFLWAHLPRIHMGLTFDGTSPHTQGFR